MECLVERILLLLFRLISRTPSNAADDYRLAIACCLSPPSSVYRLVRLRRYILADRSLSAALLE